MTAPQPDRPPVLGALLALGLAAAALAFGLTEARPRGADVLSARARLERGGVVVVEGVGAVQAASLRRGWGAVEDRAGGADVVVRVRGAASLPEAALRGAGVEIKEDRWVHEASGTSLPSARAAAAVARPVDGAVEVTLFRTEGLGGGAADRFIADLANIPLPLTRGLLLLDAGRVVHSSGAFEDAWSGGLVDSTAGRTTIGGEHFHQDELEQRLAAVHGSLAEPPAGAPSLRWVSARGEGTTPPRAAGWYDAARHELVVAAGVLGALPDAVEDYRLHLDPAAEHPAAEHPAPEGPQHHPVDPFHGRTPDAGVMVRYGGSVRASRDTFGTPHSERDFARLMELGVDGIVLDVHVPLPPRAPDEGERRPGALLRPGGASWGRSVTLEGDGAVLMAAAQAHRAGLRVGLAPRLVASPSGPHAGQQIITTAELRLDQAARAGRALEAAAELASRGRAELLVVFDRYFFPPLPGELDEMSPEDAASFRSSFDEMLHGARRLSGTLVALADRLPALAHLPAASLAPGADLYPRLGGEGAPLRDAAAISSMLRGALQRAGGRLAVAQVTLHDSPRARRGPDGWGSGEADGERDHMLRALAAALAADDSIPLVILRGWCPGGSGTDDTDLSDADPDALRAVARTR